MSDLKSLEQVILWFFGDSMGETLIRGWKWALGAPNQPTQTCDEITISDLERTLDTMRSQLHSVSPIIERVRLQTNEIERQYQTKQLSYREQISQVINAKETGNVAEARLLMARALQLEQILPELKARAERSQQRLNELIKYVERKEADLYILSLDLDEVKTKIDINRSIGPNIKSSTDLITLLAKFEYLGDRTEDLYREIQVLSQLDRPANYPICETLNDGEIDERIDLL